MVVQDLNHKSEGRELLPTGRMEGVFYQSRIPLSGWRADPWPASTMIQVPKFLRITNDIDPGNLSGDDVKSNN